jgi:hypothetical protein
MTDRHTHTQTHGHQIFYCFIVFRDLNNVQKKHKKWGYKNFVFRMNSILRHSNASRSKIAAAIRCSNLKRAFPVTFKASFSRGDIFSISIFNFCLQITRVKTQRVHLKANRRKYV